MSRSTDHQRSTTGTRLFAIALFAALASTLFAAGAPPAAAQDDEPEFARIDFERTCDVDQATLRPAEIVERDGRTQLRLALCGPIGFYPVRTEALCDQTFYPWFSDGHVCATGYSWGLNYDFSLCRAPLVISKNIFRSADEVIDAACVRPVLSNAAFPPRTLQSVTTACIEHPVVQSDPAAAELSEGDSFVSSVDGGSYVIVRGGPTCTFGCYDGFDLNCDGKIGDFCPTEIDSSSVRGVAECRESLAPG